MVYGDNLADYEVARRRARDRPRREQAAKDANVALALARSEAARHA